MKKIKIKTILAAILAVIIGILVYIYLDALRQEVNIYIATTDITKGTILTEKVLKETSVSKNDSREVAAGAMKPVGEGEMAVAVCDIREGTIIYERDVIRGSKEALTEAGVTDDKGEVNEEYFISEEKRLHTVVLDGAGAVGNALTKGDRVDVIYTRESKSSASKSSVIMKNILVSSVGSVSSADGQSAQAITLVVTPQQAVKLSYAKRNGIIDLCLNPPEVTYAATGDITDRNITQEK